MRTNLLRVCLLLPLCCGIANAQQFPFYEWPDPEESVKVTTQETDLWPVSNMIQGPGVGFDENEPNDQPGGGADTRWVTAADAGFPADYIEEVTQPVLQFDLGEDRELKEISVWGYSSGNSNGTSQFSLRFATDAEGSAGLEGSIDYGTSIAYNPTFEIFSDPAPQQYKLFSEVVTARYVELTNLDNFFIAPGDGSAPTEEFPERLLPVLPGGDRVGLGEVAFMILPDSFQPGDKLPRSINGDEFGVYEVSGTQSGQEFAAGGDPAPGLLQEWYAVGGAGTKDALNGVFASNVPVVPPFRSESGISWWSGSEAVSDVPEYPSEVEGVITGDNYSVRLSGEILIEESGTIRFLDGVDDYAYFAIDTDRSGVAGDTEEEVLINDNSWTNALSEGNGGAAIVEVDFEVEAGGEWLAMEFNMAEGGGGDHGMLYWDVDDEDDFFPTEQGLGVLDIDALVFLIPDENLRSQDRELIKADASGSLADEIRQADVLELQLQVSADGSDQIVLQDLTAGDGTATLDVAGATIRVVPEGDIAEGTEFQIFAADAVSGVDELTLLFEGDASMWDTSRLSEGLLVFGAAETTCDPTSGGDLDGNGAVEFADFLIMSANFGTAVADHTEGDIDCNGTVEFADFLVLSNAFGTAAGTSAVPEPSSVMLMLLGLLAMARLRHLRAAK